MNGGRYYVIESYAGRNMPSYYEGVVDDNASWYIELRKAKRFSTSARAWKEARRVELDKNKVISVVFVKVTI